MKYTIVDQRLTFYYHAYIGIFCNYFFMIFTYKITIYNYTCRRPVPAFLFLFILCLL